MYDAGVALVVPLKSCVGKREELILRPVSVYPEGQWIESSAMAKDDSTIVWPKSPIQPLLERDLQIDHHSLEQPLAR